MIVELLKVRLTKQQEVEKKYCLVQGPAVGTGEPELTTKEICEKAGCKFFVNGECVLKNQPRQDSLLI